MRMHPGAPPMCRRRLHVAAPRMPARVPTRPTPTAPKATNREGEDRARRRGGRRRLLGRGGARSYLEFMATQRVESDKIMARFRPIAPKPVVEPPPGPAASAVLSLPSLPRQRGTRDVQLPVQVGKRLCGGATQPHPPLLQPRHASAPWTPASQPAAAVSRRVPVERDLLSKLQEPKVIVPRPARPVRSTVCVDISSVTGANSARLAVRRTMATAEQQEAELERDALPAIISGPGNRVRHANDAYKALVGQPVCPWLDSLIGGRAGALSSRRINGEVVLDARRFNTISGEPTSAATGLGFSCSSRITWERDGTIASVAAPCDVTRLEDGGSGDYLFVWRFDITRASIFYCAA